MARYVLRRVFWLSLAFLGSAGTADLAAQQGKLKVESGVRGKIAPVQEPDLRRPADKPPSITYPSSRESSEWIEARGGKVAVDKGVEWQGKIAYLSLTYDLVVVDAKTKKTLWWDSVGAFWDSISFENRAKGSEPANWVLLLGSKERPEFVQAYDFESGKKRELKGAPAAPAGTPFKPVKAWSGSGGARDEKMYRLVGSAAEWTKLRTELFGPTPPAQIPAATELDFTQNMLLVCYAGRAQNWNGIGVDLAVENDEKMTLRLSQATYQSLNGVGDERPYGLIVLPRREGKPVVLEYNRQNYINGPPIWKEFTRVTLTK